MATKAWGLAVLKILSLALAMTLTAGAAVAQNIVPPEVVRLENVIVDGGLKFIYVGNANNHYRMFCNVKADSCITPEANKNYLLFNSDTRWKMPGATDFLTLKFIQDWTVSYSQGTNIGLVAEDTKSVGPDLGMFILDETGPGYEADILMEDGPIIYGTGMNDKDRANAWKHFFMQMFEAAARQQGKDAVGVKLARRCMPGEDICTTALDADLVGIGGIKEPRKVAVVVATDVHDPDKQLSRTVCTYPAQGFVFCRDWDTGKLMSAKHPPPE